jgi:hypothetical protein
MSACVKRHDPRRRKVRFKVQHIDGRTRVPDEAVVGSLGTVIVRIRGGELPGEIVATVRGTRETFIAFADTVMERGASVLVISSRGQRAVDVIAWAD